MIDTYIITTFSKENYTEYAKKAIQSWKQNWPLSWKLVTVDAEVDVDADIKLECPEKSSWIDFVKATSVTRELPPGHQRYWEKFCHKSWAQIVAFENLKSGHAIWMDADMQFLKTPPEELVKEEITGYFSGYLGRDNHNDRRHCYPETGIILYDFNHQYAKTHFAKLREIHTNLNLFDYPGWSDDVIYGILRNENPEVYKSISPTNSRYPLDYSRLSEYFFHWMGTNSKKKFKDV